ncbi:MAG: DNA polymerase III subunit beta, partial [Candidatus Poribacteria bacterium]
MKFTVEREALFNSLQKIQSVVEKKNTIQILGNILCVSNENSISLSATDLEVGIKLVINAKIEQEGKITLSAKHFFEIARELPNKPLHVIKKDNNWIEITCEKSRFNIVSLPADDYPALPIFEEKKYIDARSEALVNMIDKTQFAISTDATRYHLNGVYFENIENNVMRMTATDGHRLSFVDMEVFTGNPDLKRGIIIPKKGLYEIRKFLSESGSTIGLSFEKGYIFIKNNSSYLFVRFIYA